MNLSDISVEELQWWVSHIPHAKQHISHDLPSVIIQSDASKRGGEKYLRAKKLEERGLPLKTLDKKYS